MNHATHQQLVIQLDHELFWHQITRAQYREETYGLRTRCDECLHPQPSAEAAL